MTSGVTMPDAPGPRHAFLPGAARAQASIVQARRLALRRLLLGPAGGLALLCAFSHAQPAFAQPSFDLPALMTLLAQRQSGEARFTEERTVTGFDGPLRSSGTLSFTAPDRFARQTLEPQRERMEVSGNQVRLERGGRVRQMTLDAVPELAALVEGLRGTLTGNAALLRRHFELRLDGQASLWTLTLAPRDSTLAAQVRQLRLAGTGGELRSVELWMAGNDRSLMVIEPATAATAATAAIAAPAAVPPSMRSPPSAPSAPSARSPTAAASR